MAFGVEDFHDLIELLAQHPEWRAELRRHVLSDELLEMPALMRQLLDSHARAEARIGQVESGLRQLEASVQALTEAQAAANARLDRLEASVQALTEAQARAEARLERVEIRLEHVEGRLGEVEQRLDRIDVRLGEMDGDLMELHYAHRGLSYLSPIARRLRAVDPSRLAEMLDDAADEGVLTERERAAVMLADVIFSGRRRDDGQEIYILAEVSSGIGAYDVERAAERAAILQKIGRPVLPIVAGRKINAEAVTLADRLGVWRAVDGRVSAPPTA